MSAPLLTAVLSWALSLPTGMHPDEPTTSLMGLGPDVTAAADSTRFVAWYESLRNLRPDAARGANVEGVTLERDAATFELVRGTIHLLEEVDGRTIGAVFSGEGHFRVTVPDPVERAHLVRTFETPDDPAMTFENAVFLFTDFTLSELEQGVTWGPLEPSGAAKDEVEEARQYLTDGDGWVDRTVTLPVLNGGPGFFYAHFSEDRGDPLIFAVDPHQAEEISLWRRTERGKRRSLMARFHRQVDYTTGRSLPQEALDLVKIHGYDIETEIEGGLDLTGRAAASMSRMQAGFDWVPFSLYSDLDVDSIRWGDGSPVAYYRPDDSSDLWVDVSSLPAETADLVFHYSGDMMDRPQDLWVQIASHTTWYPVYTFGREIPYRLTFHTDDDYVLTTVGMRVEHRTEDDRVTSVYETPPIRNVTFNIGDFDALETAPPNPDDPGLTVLINESAHKRFGAMLAERGAFLLEQQDMAEMVAHDLRSSFTFFNEVYGPTQVRNFVATEIPYSHGEAYPGLVMLAWNTFQWTSSEGFDEMFRAHEVSHQWWGIGVRPATYRDWWLAEGFSEFSGWWYAARAQGSIDMYLRRLKATREAILDRRGESPPIALGTRAGSEDHPEDYQLTVYHKSAWVLHMLRTLMTDVDTGSDDAFTGMMQSFYSNHLGGTASTIAFQRAVEGALGGSMQWFFDAWVYGSEIPTYVFSHRYEDVPDGVVATVRIRQEEVPEDFRMVVPIMLDFGDEGTATVRVDVSGPVTEVELPLLPRVPDDILFNPFEAVLAEVKTEDWKD